MAEDFAVDWSFRISECVVEKNVLCSLKSELQSSGGAVLASTHS